MLRITGSGCDTSCLGCGQALRHRAGRWHRQTGHDARQMPNHRVLFACMAALLSTGTSQSIAAEPEAAPPTEPIRSLAAEQADTIMARGMAMGAHCRSGLDGSNAMAAEQLRARAGDTLQLIETAISPAANGRHNLVVLYSVEIRAGVEAVSETRGWIDSATCKAHLDAA